MTLYAKVAAVTLYDGKVTLAVANVLNKKVMLLLVF